jgi:predicted phosphatase
VALELVMVFAIVIEPHPEHSVMLRVTRHLRILKQITHQDYIASGLGSVQYILLV